MFAHRRRFLYIHRTHRYRHHKCWHPRHSLLTLLHRAQSRLNPLPITGGRPSSYPPHHVTRPNSRIRTVVLPAPRKIPYLFPHSPDRMVTMIVILLPFQDMLLQMTRQFFPFDQPWLVPLRDSIRTFHNRPLFLLWKTKTRSNYLLGRVRHFRHMMHMVMNHSRRIHRLPPCFLRHPQKGNKCLTTRTIGTSA